jgi:signal transduction histidine kinase
LGSAQLLMLERPTTDPDFELLRNIEESARRCRDITGNLLRFSQSFGVGQPRTVDLNAVVRSALALDAPAFAQAQVTVEAHLAPGAIDLFGDPDQLAQVLLGLFSNARTAMLKVTPKHLTVTSALTPAGPRITVRDTGKGIAQEHLTRIFEPFFSTKDIWSNVGLGLSIAYRIVTEHGGRLEVASEVGKGATFVLQLPAAQQAPRNAPALRAAGVGGEGVGVTG